MKKKELIVTLIIAFILIIAMCYTFLNPINNNLEQPNIDIEESENESIEEIQEDETIYSESEFNNKYKLSGYRKVDIPNAIPEFEWGVKINEMTEMKDDADYNLEFHYLKDAGVEDVYVGAEIINNKVYFVFNDTKLEIPINNIKKVYILWDEVYSEKYILYFLTTDGELYEFGKQNSFDILNYNLYDKSIKTEEQLNDSIIEQLNILIENIEKVNNKIKYDKLLILDYGETFNFDYAGLGYDDKFYLLDDEKEFTKNDFPYSQFSFHKDNIYNIELIYLVDLDGNVIINPFVNINIKFKFGISNLIIDENDIIYKVVYDEKYKLQEIGKLKLLYVNNKEKKLAILLEDGKVMTGSYNENNLQNIEF